MKRLRYILFLLIIPMSCCKNSEKDTHDASEANPADREVERPREVEIPKFLEEYSIVITELEQLILELPADLKDLDPTSREIFTERIENITKKYQLLVQDTDGKNSIILNDLERCKKIKRDLSISSQGK